MVASTFLSGSQRMGPVVSQFKASNFLGNTSLFTKINWIFGLYAGYLAIGVSYCLYNLYRTYQLRCHHFFGLDDCFKIIKCEALLYKAQEESCENPRLLLQQCEDLLDSINDRTNIDKENLLLGLVQYHAKDNPDHSYQIALRLSFSYGLLHAVGSIQEAHPNFDPVKLSALVGQAFNAKNQEDEASRRNSPLEGISNLLNFAGVFKAVGNNALASQYLAKALEMMTNAVENDLTRIETLCRIARSYREMEDLENMNSSTKLAQQLLDKTKGFDLIQARLVLADTFLSIGNFEEMDRELDEAVKGFQDKTSLLSTSNLYSLAVLIRKIDDKGAESRFKTFDVRSLIEKALDYLTQTSSEELTVTDRVEAYLAILEVFLEDFLEDTAMKNRVLEDVIKELQNLLESKNAEISFKMDLIIRFVRSYFLSYPSESKVQEIFNMLESLYDQCPPDSNFILPCFGRLNFSGKFGFGKLILMLYNKIGAKGKADVFFKKYLFDVQKQEDREAPFNTIIKLTAYATPQADYEDYCQPEQIQAQLEAAEALLTQTVASNEYKYALFLIMKAYLQVDRKKSLKLLENYKNQQARVSLLTAIATPMIMGVIHFVITQVARKNFTPL